MNYHTPDWLTGLEAEIANLDLAVRERRSTLELTDAADALVALNRLRDFLKIAYDDLANIVSSLMNEVPEINLPDGSKIEKKGDSSRTGWQHKDLANAVVDRLTQMSIDMDTGEVLMSGPEMAMRMLEFIQPSYWRIKELGNLGINADHYSKVGEYKESIIVRKAK